MNAQVRPQGRSPSVISARISKMQIQRMRYKMGAVIGRRIIETVQADVRHTFSQKRIEIGLIDHDTASEEVRLTMCTGQNVLGTRLSCLRRSWPIVAKKIQRFVRTHELSILKVDCTSLQFCCQVSIDDNRNAVRLSDPIPTARQRQVELN